MSTLEKIERSTIAKQRSILYGLLAMIYRQEVTSDLLNQIKDPQFLGVLSDSGIRLEKGFFDKPEAQLLEDLAVEYAKLFLGPGKHVSPHESVHHQREDGKWGQLWGESTVEVKKFIESTGLHYQPEYKGLPDHISVELEFMQQLTLREEQAWEESDREGAVFCRKIEKKFIEDHLSQWIPPFCEKVMDEAQLPFYRELAAFTRKFIEFEKQEVNRYADHLT
ncbi:MAG: molecular chaperone TorD family protein [Deltaproteobacteria bacterium]|nr:molecular chaperone TorD family protein [Deltaproteobacteria bacterium]MBW2152417.1 molecular chaperone TorD family protein [Deltaproteobacteria bacterium]